MEFHITRGAREKYQFDDLLFSYNGNVIFANFQASRKFAHLMNQQRSDPTDVKTYIAPGQINALGLIDEVFHLVISSTTKKTASIYAAPSTTTWSNRLAKQDFSLLWNPSTIFFLPHLFMPTSKPLRNTLRKARMVCRMLKTQLKKCSSPG